MLSQSPMVDELEWELTGAGKIKAHSDHNVILALKSMQYHITWNRVTKRYEVFIDGEVSALKQERPHLGDWFVPSRYTFYQADIEKTFGFKPGLAAVKRALRTMTNRPEKGRW